MDWTPDYASKYGIHEPSGAKRSIVSSTLENSGNTSQIDGKTVIVSMLGDEITNTAFRRGPHFAPLHGTSFHKTHNFQNNPVDRLWIHGKDGHVSLSIAPVRLCDLEYQTKCSTHFPPVVALIELCGTSQSQPTPNRNDTSK